MTHYTPGKWVDYVRGVAADPQSMAAHLDTGCARCARRHAAAEHLARLAAAESRDAPPAYALRGVKAFFGLQQPQAKRPSLLQALRFETVFDSALAPAAAGVRRTAGERRELILRSEEYELDLEIEPIPRSDRTRVAGLLLEHSARPSVHVPIYLLADDRVVASAFTGELGDFSLDCPRDLPLTLRLQLEGRLPFDLALTH